MGCLRRLYQRCLWAVPATMEVPAVEEPMVEVNVVAVAPASGDEADDFLF